MGILTARRAVAAAVLALLAVLPPVVAAAQEDSAETLREQSLALAEQQNPAPPLDVTNLLERAVPYPLFVAVDDATVPAYLIDPATNTNIQAFVGGVAWGAAYDMPNNRILFNNGSTLYQWPVGGAISSLGTIHDPAGTGLNFTGLTYYSGMLYGVRNIANEAVYAIDPTTLVATVYIEYVDGNFDYGGLAVDPSTGVMYATNDDTSPNGSGLFRINSDGTGTLITSYPAGQTDIDGLAVSDDGFAYLVIDEPGSIYVWNFTTSAWGTPLTSPFTTSEVFCGGAWIWEIAGPEISLVKTVGTTPGVCATTTSITVAQGTTVYYCYEVTNTGIVELTLHDLTDSVLGPLFSGVAYNLAPGTSVNTVAQGLSFPAVINVPTTNTGTWTAYNAGPVDVAVDSADATVDIAPPDITVNPTSLLSSQLTNQVVTLPLSIGNVGGSQLDWTLFEEPVGPFPPMPEPPGQGDPSQVAERVGEVTEGQAPEADPTASRWPGPRAVLYDNGPLVTHPGGGAGGADASALQTALGMGTYGFGAQVSAGNRVADEFTVTDAAGWTIDTITFFAYQTGSGTTSTINALNLQIWNGAPNGGGVVVWGDTSTNILASSVWSNIYRVLDTALTDTQRPIMACVATVGTTLPPGTYWLDWQFGGTLASGPWQPAVSILGQTTTGNAMQYTPAGGWANLVDVGPQGLPFIVEGNPAICGNLADVPWLSANPTAGSVPAGGSQPVDVTFDSTGLAVGLYTANVCLFSNDPVEPVVAVPVTLEVVIPVELMSFTIE